MNSSTPTFVCIFYYFLCQQALIIAAWVACVFLFWLALPVTRLQLECKTNEVVIVMWSTLSFQYLRSKQTKTLDLAFNLLMYAIFKFSFFDSVLQSMLHCTLLVWSIHLPFKRGFSACYFLYHILKFNSWANSMIILSFKYEIQIFN